ncbi:MAG: hypothetical protein ABR902_07155 [Candidatus Korobacteraceae bacterium]|jgi:hypothetical protein
MSTKANVPKLRILSSMSLEQAMAEVRRYLAAKNKAGSGYAFSNSPDKTGSGSAPSQLFNLQSANLAGLSEIAARLGHIEPHSEMGAAGVFLKRAMRKAIGWYSRPVHEFDRATVAALQQIRQDMLGLQQQIAALRQEMASGASAGSQSDGDSVTAQNSPSEQAELLLLTIELFKNQVAMQALRQALRQENPQLLQRVESLLSKFEGESSQLKAALLVQLMQGTDSR